MPTNVNLSIHRHKAAPGKRAFQPESPDDDRYGFWGMVTDLHPENHTVHVRTPEGRVIPNVRVSSNVWVTIDKDKGFLSGRRYMPPVNTFVLVFMPNGHYSSAVIIASGFSDDTRHENFKAADPKAKEDIEDKNEIDEFIKNSGWKYTEDNRTGTRVLQNKPKEPTIKLEIDQEEDDGDEKAMLTIHGNIFTVDKENGIKIQTDKNIVIEGEGNTSITVDKCSLVTDGNKWTIDADGNKIEHDGNKTLISSNLEVSK